MLDTVHTHPWETLNFLCVLPFMKRDSWTVLHDISLFVNPNNRDGLACRYLFASVVSDEKISPRPEEGGMNFANMGAFRVSDVTEKYIDNLFEALVIPWNIQVSERDLADITAIISKYYSQERYEFFCKVLELQEHMFRHQMTLRGSLKRSIKQRTSPKVFAFLQKMKRSLRIQ